MVSAASLSKDLPMKLEQEKFGAGLMVSLWLVAKSAQFPLHVWLPDAMEGPTPISALIHAATMVAAGIFLVARLLPLFIVIPDIMNLICLVCIITVLLGATLALAQRDIKRSLAYSTMSQLGYIMLALGIGSYRAAFFHLITHAYSKAFFLPNSQFGSPDQNLRKLGYLDSVPLESETSAFPFTRISSVSSILSRSSLSSEQREGFSSVDPSCSCLVSFISEVVSTSLSSFLSPPSSVSEVSFSFSFLVTIGDGILPK
ncbi:hypothetical protein IEQ34_023277 [Dendrobium chrysotoxum]|uniref:NADH:quinone oxidoreductase/Mrp antiporter transmembrane domain-containing protein n=1 Tax=Dendrobium chrysotoxum TaxID=161865 RepID=A0AAV7FRY2_DENCH|nr:hypothetical protein IEQ34_026235 [Dendrobium chrysotoxum]KAH0438470.1 hypothetical protein IEQ34_026077 [Dendrobium chrysotoxum]KAH0439851.1 hypothetical protein IEQ34_025795 [Dendrobium chrysotoxum]KAH0440100.1 hypothetical protein IEQ34_025749 [Dendrobium chrysotoxum]KAH0440171.1 hypothetical protein IEQ34_025718 [Dendrobium chrysotoxum]